MTSQVVRTIRGLSVRLAIVLTLPIAFVMSDLMHAQAPAPVAARQTAGADPLPVRRGGVYKSGVA